MSDSALIIAGKVATPVISLVAGWVGAALKLRQRLSALETTVFNISEKFKSLDQIKQVADKEQAGEFAHIERRLTKITENVAQLKGGMRLEMNAFREAILTRVANVESDLKELDSVVSRFRDSSTDYAKDAELADYISQQGAQWNEIQRTIGEIIGELRSLQKHLK